MKQDRKEKSNVPNLRFPQFKGEWEKRKICQILKIGSGRDYRHLNKGDIPVFGTGGYMTSVDDYLMDGETVCVGRKGTINKPFYYSGRFWTVDTLFYTHSYKTITPKFTFYTFEHINWLKYNEASGVPSLSKSTIEQIEITLPSLAEQEKIATFLSLIDQRIETQNKIIEDLKKLKTALVDGLLYDKNKGVRFRFPHFINRWKQYQLLDICTLFSGGTPLSSNKKYYEGDIPFIRSGEINSDRTELFISEEGLRNSSSKKIQKGDLIVALYGATSGEIALSKTNGAINQAILCISTTHNKLFLKYTWEKHVKNILKTYLQGGQGNLSTEIIKQLKFYFPDENEQNKIAIFLDSIESLIDFQTKIANSYVQQKKILLKQMFI